jgi:selenocysteine lyase/cysteine desulfurase
MRARPTTSATASPRAAAASLPPTPALLAMGGDSRIAVSGQAQTNRYGRRPFPDPELVPFGSSTASTISPLGFATAERWRADILQALAHQSPGAVHAAFAEVVRSELAAVLGLQDMAGLEAILAASGTDLHRIAARVVAGDDERPLRVILAAAGETGTGVAAALNAAGGCDCEVTAVRARAPDGGVRPSAIVDAEVERLAREALRAGGRVLVVMVDVSKTGLATPSLEVARRLGAQSGDVTVLVDACQLRLSASALRGYLDAGFLVAVTGSKFAGGPAFCGALLAPEKAAARLRDSRPAGFWDGSSVRGDWPAGWAARTALPHTASFGLLLRWGAALAELQAFAALPPAKVAAFTARFAQMAADAIAEEPALLAAPGVAAAGDPPPTIFPVLLAPTGQPFGAAAAGQVELLMRSGLGEWLSDRPDARRLARNRFEMGQPVVCGAPGAPKAAALRLCLGAPAIVRALSTPKGEAQVLALGRAALAKAAALAEELARRGVA